MIMYALGIHALIWNQDGVPKQFDEGGIISKHNKWNLID